MFNQKLATISALFAATVSTALVTLPAMANNGAIAPSLTTETSSPNAPYLLAQTRRAYTVTYVWNSGNIKIKGVASGNLFDVYISNSIGAEVGDTITVTFKSDDKWGLIINDRTGLSATVTSVRRI